MGLLLARMFLMNRYRSTVDHFLGILLIIGSVLSSDAQTLPVKAMRREMIDELGYAVWVNHTIVSLWSVLMHIRMIMLSMEYFL